MPTQAMSNHVFTILFQIPGAAEPDDYARRAYEDRRLQDLLLGGPDGRGTFDADFDRRAASFTAAVLSAIADLRRVFPEGRLLRVDPDDLVTLSGIASRVGRTHESVRLLATGKRGPGAFPADAGELEGKTRVWRWHEVVSWFEADLGVEVPGSENAAFLAGLNDILSLRRVAPEAVDSVATARAMAALLPEQIMAAATTLDAY
jgi:hypothetical protein